MSQIKIEKTERGSTVFEFPTGFRFTAYGGVLGLSVSGLSVYEGYDGCLFWGKNDRPSAEDRQALADYMCERWQAWVKKEDEE